MKATLALLATAALAAGCASFKGIEPKGSLANPADLEAGASLASTAVGLLKLEASSTVRLSTNLPLPSDALAPAWPPPFASVV